MDGLNRLRRGRPRLVGATALLAVLAAVLVVVFATGGGHALGPQGRTSAGSASAASAGSASSGSAAGGSTAGTGSRVGSLADGRIRFALDLRLNERRLNAYLAHVRAATPSGRGLTAVEFGERFGLSDGQLGRLRAVLVRLGIAVDHIYPQRTAALVTTTVARMRQVFMLRFARYRLPGGQRYFAPDGAPHLPAALDPYVSGLGDLSDRPVLSEDIPNQGLLPTSLAAAYDISPLYAAGIRGQGQTIAIATAEGAINPADLSAYAQAAHITEPDVEVRKVDGGSAYSEANGSDPEVDTDLEIVSGIAPRARIIDYQGPENAQGDTLSLGHSLADIYNAIEQDGLAKIVSTSYGECESYLASENPGDQTLMDNSLKALEASNVTVFVATGDTGAYACLQVAQVEPDSTIPSSLTQLSVQTPATSPYVVAVGGTRLEVRANGSYLAESAWGDPLERAGGGGGFSDSEPRPVWQRGPGVIEPARDPHGHRGTPDVSGPADPFAGFLLCETAANASSPTCGSGNGGTSAAAPFWAASWALVEEYAERHGAASLAHCFAGPILYDLADTHQPVPPFHKIVYGNNGYYSATSVWNPATGLGSPDVFNLAQDDAALLRSQKSHTCPF